MRYSWMIPLTYSMTISGRKAIVVSIVCMVEDVVCMVEDVVCGLKSQVKF